MIENKFIAAIYRFIRYLSGNCIVCGRSVHTNKAKIYYCSFECAGYDGCFSVRAGVKVNKPKLLSGKWTQKHYRKENWN